MKHLFILCLIGTLAACSAEEADFEGSGTANRKKAPPTAPDTNAENADTNTDREDTDKKSESGKESEEEIEKEEIQKEAEVVNKPPVITSSAVLSFDRGIPVGDRRNFGYASWSVVEFLPRTDNTNAIPNWVVSTNKIEQTKNALPTAFISDEVLKSQRIVGNWKTINTTDDDFMGFVFGYQDPHHFYLFDWKKGDQGAGKMGMTVKKFDKEADLKLGDFTSTDQTANRKAPLYKNSVAWKPNVQYSFELSLYGTEYHIRISETESKNVLADFKFTDPSYPSGKFGFYNASQPSVSYSGFYNLKIEGNDYTYQIVAKDPENDELTYTLLEAPAGMTIDKNGLIVWPSESMLTGEHNVEVAVTDSHGNKTTQMFKIGEKSKN